MIVYAARESLVYLDSNIYSLAGNDPVMARGLLEIARRGHIFVMSETILGELHQAERKHESIARLMDGLPVRLFQNHAQLVKNAIASYPNESSIDPSCPNS